MLNGVIDVANRIELGQCRAGLVVSCETAREINEVTIDRLLKQLELLNLQGRSRSLSAWHRRLYSLRRMPKATRLDLISETSPRHVMDELCELQQRLIRDLADSENEKPERMRGQVSPTGDRDGSPLRGGLQSA